MTSAFPGRRRKADMKHERMESPAMKAKEDREERTMKRETLRLKKRSK